MILGTAATSLTFVALIISLASYFFFYRTQLKQLLKLGRYSFYLSSILVLYQAILLLWGIFTHRFEWQYVFSYSSRDLSDYYLLTTFWGGQEGTFLLWLLLGCGYGIVIIRKKFSSESLIMFFLILVQAFITVILIKKNPFAYVWEINPSRFQAGVIPVDGNGLNPLLQDPWMIIHPPVLFTGYSSSMLLFAFAMAVLVRRQFDDWIKEVFPFALFVSVSLGTGIILGGYWAYTTLGWGGYWGWDPVENSSLIPWLTSLAFLHGIIIQRRQGGLKRTNIFLALLTFILVIYGSFLTRSGILADFSVHSFSTSVIYDYLVFFVIIFTAISIAGYIWGARNLEMNRIGQKMLTRETFMFFGILALLLSAIFTFIGTSAPLFTKLFTGTAANVSVDYYNLLNTPVAVVIGILLSISPLLSWKNQNEKIIRDMIPHAILAVICGIAAYMLSVTDGVPLLLLVVFVFAISVNGQIVVRMMRKKQYSFGGYLSHVGVGFMIIGIIGSSVYEKTAKVALPIGSEKNVLGYEMKYLGFRMDIQKKDEAVIEIRHAGLGGIEATPKFYWSEFNQAYMRNPSVHNLWIKDLYISPIQVIPANEVNAPVSVKIPRGASHEFEEYVLHFSGYEMTGHDESDHEMKVFALFSVAYDGSEYHVKPGIVITENRRTGVPALLPGSNRYVQIQEINIDEDAITIGIDKPIVQQSETKEYLAVEITEKPLINLLWLGTVLMISGFLMQLIYRVNVRRF